MLRYAAIPLLALISGPAVGQGVPEIDLSQILKFEAQRASLEAQNAEAAKMIEEREAQLAKREDQIAALQETITLLRNSSGLTTNIDSMAGFESANVYAIEDNNPYAARLFGDARETIEQMIAETAIKYGGHPALARAGINTVEFRCWFQGLVKQESQFKIGARSNKAAFGLTQIIPGTAQYLGIYPAYYEDPRLQLDGGARYLLIQLSRFGSMPLALAAYNAGPEAVQKYNGIPPYAETQDYVIKITANYNRYASQIVGADQIGTLSPQDMAIAEMSNIGDAAISYAGENQLILIQALERLQRILSEIPATASAKEAMDLNTYAKAEVAKMAAVMVRLTAAKRKAEWAQYGTLFAAYARDREFFAELTR